MPASAPSSRARASFSSEDEVTKSRPATGRASWKSVSASPPPMPVTRTHSPGFRSAWVNNIRYAVMKVTPRAAASAKERWSGKGKTLRAGSFTSSANVPGRCSPIIRKDTHCDCSPARHCSQPPQDTAGFTRTPIPGRIPPTSSPTAAISPAPSAPSTKGKETSIPNVPDTVQRSRWFRAAARTRTTTSPGPGSGSGSSRSRASSGPPYPSIAIAFMRPELRTRFVSDTPAGYRRWRCRDSRDAGGEQVVTSETGEEARAETEGHLPHVRQEDPDP